MSDNHRHIDHEAGDSNPASRRLRAVFAGVMLVLAAGFTALGLWQVQRLGWKLDLIERVEARVAAAPVAAPARAEWPQLTVASHEYLRVSATGHFLHDKEALVQAVTDLGAGFWVLTPLQRADGTAVLVNRGFVPPERRDRPSRGQGQVEGEVAVAGLLRFTEPGGAFLRRNDPAGDHWYSRDVAAITAARGIADAAPFFIDADAAPNPGGFPVGGLTVVRFRNSHLAYALTWFALAAMSIGAGYAVWRRRFT